MFRAECDICDAQTHVHTRAAGVSPPWSVNRTQCGENRPPFDHDATHEQERRASARRGTGKRICNGDRLFRTQRVRPSTVGHRPTAGLHQPLLVASADAVADVRFVSASPLPIPTAGLHQPLLVASADAVADVRFVSASPLPIPTAGLRQPLLVARRVFRAECDICDAQTHVHKSGGRQPAVVPENASATATDFSEPSMFAPARSVSIPRLAYTSRSRLSARMVLLMCVSYPQVRYPHHGWLTPAAPGCATFSGSIAGLTPPVTKLPEPFFHPNRIKTTTLYPTGRGAARTCSEKQSRYERAKKRGEFAGLLERIRRSNPTYEVHGSG